MKKLTLILLAFFMLGKIYAQETPNEFSDRHNFIFQNLDRSGASTGILLDYGIEFQNLDKFTGTVLLDSNFVSLNDWRSIYASLLTSQYNNQVSLTNPASINTVIDSFTGDALPLTFALLHYNYNILRPDAIGAGLFTANNDQLFDVANRPQSPYLQKTAFAVAPVQNYYRANNGYAEFVLRNELVFGNSGKTVSQIRVDFGNGSGWQSVTIGTVKGINYSSTGYKELIFEVTYTDNTVYTSHTRVYIDYLAEDTSPGGGSISKFYNRIADQQISAATGGGTKYATLQIALSQQRTSGEIEKPLIVIEGIDFWKITNPSYPDANTDINDLLGFQGQLQNVNLFPSDNLENKLDLAGYDIIYVDFDDGADNLNYNIELVKTAIDWVNSHKSGSEQNVVMGVSMGAVLARSALKQMENASINHQTRLYISVDGPHQGANIPLGLQAMVKHLASAQLTLPFGLTLINFSDMFPEINVAKKVLETPAAQQLLKYTINNSDISSLAHDNFFSAYQSQGYPGFCRNIAISNGSECGNLQPFAPNAVIFSRNTSANIATVFDASLAWIQVFGIFTNRPLLGLYAPLALLSTKTSLETEFEVRALPNQTSDRIYKGRVGIKRRILGLFNVNANIINRSVYSNPSILPFDTAPGGQISFANNSIGIPPSFANQFQVPSFCFIPTVSSLDIGSSSSSVNYSRLNSGYNRDSPPASPYNSPFANFITTVKGNEGHVAFTSRNGDFLLKELSSSTTGFVSCAVFCNAFDPISGASQICSSSAYSVPNLPTGAIVNWSVSPTNIVNLTTSNNVATITKIGNGFVDLSATISSICGNMKLPVKRVSVGTYSPENFPITGETSICANTVTTYSVNALPGATGYNWIIPPAALTNGWYIIAGQGTPVLTVNTGSNSTSIKLKVSNNCGEGITPAILFVNVNCGTSRFAISPNPANSNINISQDAGSVQKDKNFKVASENTVVRPYNVKIFDHNARLLKTGVSQGGEDITVDTGNIPNGTYFLHIFQEKEVIKKQIIVSH